MNVHSLKTAAVLKQIHRNQLTEKDIFGYYLGGILMWNILLYYSYIFGAELGWMLVIELAAILVITIIGLLSCYRVNGGNHGKDLLTRIVCLSLPIGIKINVISIALSWAISSTVLKAVDSITFRNPEWILNLFALMWVCIFSILFYRRLWSNIKRLQ